MVFRIAALLEVTFVIAACLSLLLYAPPLGLLLPSTYVSTRLVRLSMRKGATSAATLARTGAVWGVATVVTCGLGAATVMIAHRAYKTDSGLIVGLDSWLLAILFGFVIGYGGAAAAIGGLIGACSGAYARTVARRNSN